MKSIFCVILIFLSTNSFAQNKTIETSGDVLLFVIPTATLTATLLINDHKGTWQFSKGLLLNTAITTSLKLVVNKERPNSKDNLSFPSGHTSTVFQSAAFVHKRYGFKYAIPSYILGSYTGFSRIQSNNHDFVDVTAGAIIGVGSAFLFTTMHEKDKLQISFSKNESYNVISLLYNF